MGETLFKSRCEEEAKFGPTYGVCLPQLRLGYEKRIIDVIVRVTVDHWMSAAHRTGTRLGMALHLHGSVAGESRRVNVACSSRQRDPCSTLSEPTPTLRTNETLTVYTSSTSDTSTPSKNPDRYPDATPTLLSDPSSTSSTSNKAVSVSWRATTLNEPAITLFMVRT